MYAGAHNDDGSFGEILPSRVAGRFCGALLVVEKKQVCKLCVWRGVLAYHPGDTLCSRSALNFVRGGGALASYYPCDTVCSRDGYLLRSYCSASLLFVSAFWVRLFSLIFAAFLLYVSYHHACIRLCSLSVFFFPAAPPSAHTYSIPGIMYLPETFAHCSYITKSSLSTYK